MSGVIVIVGVNGADYQLILKNNNKVFSVTLDFLNQIHVNTKIVSFVNLGRIQNK
jgi:hypothetical protein